VHLYPSPSAARSSLSFDGGSSNGGMTREAMRRALEELQVGWAGLGWVTDGLGRLVSSELQQGSRGGSHARTADSLWIASSIHADLISFVLLLPPPTALRLQLQSNGHSRRVTALSEGSSDAPYSAVSDA
jgi:hypothetical protein